MGEPAERHPGQRAPRKGGVWYNPRFPNWGTEGRLMLFIKVKVEADWENEVIKSRISHTNMQSHHYLYFSRQFQSNIPFCPCNKIVDISILQRERLIKFSALLKVTEQLRSGLRNQILVSNLQVQGFFLLCC